MFALRKFTRKSPKNSIVFNLFNIPKRNFWKIEEHALSVHVRGIGKKGILFSHHNVICTIDNEEINCNEMNSFHISLDKHSVNDYFYFRKCMDSGEKIVIKIEKHMVGVPWLGNNFCPLYVK